MPLVVALTILGLRKEPIVTAVLATISMAGGPLILAELIRHYGRKAQKTLWAQWGGSPTTAKLRLREGGQKPLQREVWRKAVSSVTGVELASARSERANASAADEKIEIAVDQLRDLTRDTTKFHLVWVENRGYGFHRNLYGIRWFGRFVSLMLILGIGGYVIWRDRHGQALTPLHFSALAVGITGLLGWLIIPSTNRVREAADRYAFQLLQAAVTLSKENESPTMPANP
jgi:hypothetical protein